MKKIKVLMCGSELSVKGGMVSVIKNYLGYQSWDEFQIRYIPTHTENNKLIVAFYFALACIRVIVTAVAGKYDIIYLHTAERGSFYRKAILAHILQICGLKAVMHHHAAEFEEFYDGLPKKRKKYVNDTLGRIDLNIVLSNRLVSSITKKAPNATVRVLYNAVDAYKVNPYNADAACVLFLGRLGERKGVYDLLKAIELLDTSLSPDIKFLLCGDGEIDEVKKQVEERKIQHRIGHVGWIDSKQKHDFFQQTILNVLPSYNEGLPMSILETMACGIPNISTRIASIPEVIREGINGEMFNPGDVNELAKKISMLCEDVDTRKRMSKQAWGDVSQKFALSTHMEKLKEYMREIL